MTYGELFSVQPFGNQVVKTSFTGDEIYGLLEQRFGSDGRARILQVSGLEFSHNPQNPAGSRITAVTLPDGTRWTAPPPTPSRPTALWRLAATA